MALPPVLAPVYRVIDLRAIEESARALPLMERAGLAAAEVARAMAGDRGGKVLLLAGPGNNGGDALVVARWLRQWYFDTTVVFRADPAKLPRDAAAAHRAFVAAGGTTLADIPPAWQGTLVVDGLFGIGLKRALTADYAALVDQVNASAVPILALDVPSGLDAETGSGFHPTIRAAATATFIALKPGLLTGAGVDCCGTLSVHALELDPETIVPAQGRRLAWSALAAALPDVLRRRLRNVHKGTFGTLCSTPTRSISSPGIRRSPLRSRCVRPRHWQLLIQPKQHACSQLQLPTSRQIAWLPRRRWRRSSMRRSSSKAPAASSHIPTAAGTSMQAAIPACRLRGPVMS